MANVNEPQRERYALLKVAQYLADSTEPSDWHRKRAARLLEDADLVPAEAYREAKARADTLEAGLLGLAGMIVDYFGGVFGDSEPDESDLACHLWNAAEALRMEPGEVQTWLYAEHEPCEGHDAERALIAAGKVLRAPAESSQG